MDYFENGFEQYIEKKAILGGFLPWLATPLGQIVGWSAGMPIISTGISKTLQYLWPDKAPDTNLNIANYTTEPSALLKPLEATKNIPYIGQYINPVSLAGTGLGIGLLNTMNKQKKILKKQKNIMKNFMEY